MRYLLPLITIFFFGSCYQNRGPNDILNLKPKLEGKWIASAFDGELHEEWKLGPSGWMKQEGYYIVKGDTSYSAKTQIQKVNDDIILFSVIKDSNPKIFKAIQATEKGFIFKNDDYTNPYEVKYEFISDDTYRRTIKGMEQDSLVVYEFEFQKAGSKH
jgi:hypothetical protein